MAVAAKSDADEARLSSISEFLAAVFNESKKSAPLQNMEGLSFIHSFHGASITSFS